MEINVHKRWKIIQDGAFRFVYKDYVSTYKELLAKGNHSMLYISRIRIIAIEVYKVLNELSLIFA